MAYYYQDPTHNDDDDGDQGNDEYDEYSAYAEPDHCEYEDQYHNDVDHEYAPQEFEQEHWMAEHEVQELKELVHNGANARMDSVSYSGIVSRVFTWFYKLFTVIIQGT